MKKTNLLVGLICIAGLSSCQKEKSKPNIIYILMVSIQKSVTDLTR